MVHGCDVVTSRVDGLEAEAIERKTRLLGLTATLDTRHGFETSQARSGDIGNDKCLMSCAWALNTNFYMNDSGKAINWEVHYTSPEARAKRPSSPNWSTRSQQKKWTEAEFSPRPFVCDSPHRKPIFNFLKTELRFCLFFSCLFGLQQFVLCSNIVSTYIGGKFVRFCSFRYCRETLEHQHLRPSLFRKSNFWIVKAT